MRTVIFVPLKRLTASYLKGRKTYLMKHIMLVFALCSTIGACAQSQGVLDELSLALESGNAQKVGTYFKPKVTLGIQNEEDTYESAMAKQKLGAFFRQYPPEAFNTLHKGAAKENARYVIGKLKTGEKAFRTYLLIETNQQQPRIQELRFE